MILRCKTCGFMAKSLIIEKEDALLECIRTIGAHVGCKHPSALQAYAAELQRLIPLLDTALLPLRLVDIPTDEPFPAEVAKVAESQLLFALGLDTDDPGGPENPPIPDNPPPPDPTN